MLCKAACCTEEKVWGECPRIVQVQEGAAGTAPSWRMALRELWGRFGDLVCAPAGTHDERKDHRAVMPSLAAVPGRNVGEGAAMGCDGLVYE